MFNSNCSMSLVERKKLQWAKEREELATLSAPWGSHDHNLEFERNRYEPKIPMVNNGYTQKNTRQINRRGSLPPLYKNQFNSYDRYEREKEVGGETSGYGSDNPNHTPECIQNWNQSGYESSSSRDDRLKWGDKGVGTGKFWLPKEDTFSKGAMIEPPNWVKRGLQDGEIVVTNTSPAESPEQRYEEHERPHSGSSYYHHRNTYIRGQNIPIDSIELAERERKRQAAMEHQEAIRKQLEERERRRHEERERRIKEEHEEELRIEREQDIERQRKEHEMRMIKEKQERERKRKEAIEEAIELAQKEAILEKSRKNHKPFNNNLNNIKVHTESERTQGVSNIGPDSKSTIKDNPKAEENKNNCVQLNNTRSIPARTETLNNEINNNLEVRGKSINSPRSSRECANGNKPETPTFIENCNNQNSLPSNFPQNALQTARGEHLALFFQPTLDVLPNLQYALLVPATSQSIQQIAVPLTIPQTDRSFSSTRTENRVLTPTQYRNKNSRICDSSTQTEYGDFGRAETSCDNREKYIREKLTNLELSYDNRNRRERRSRSESMMEERPKWGANRPPTRYLKQSEKDPLYLRRKLRQKIRETKTFDDRNSSDESQTASPRSYRKRVYADNRNSRAHWRKGEQVFSRNIRMYQTELVPLESDKDQLYYKNNESFCVCRCGRHRCSEDSVKVDILKIEHQSPRENVEYKIEMTEKSERLPDVQIVNSNILDKLSSLHNGLLLKQEEWENSPGTPSLSSSIRQ